MRLTKSRKENILNQVIAKLFDKQEEDLATAKRDLAHDIYDDQFDAVEQKLMTSLPNGYLKEGTVFYTYFDNDYLRFTLNESKRFQANNWQYSEFRFDKYENPKHPVFKAFSKWKKSEKSFKEEKKKTTAQVNALLESVTTYNKLKELWPEVIQHVSLDEAKPSSITSLAPVLTDINRKLATA